MRRVKFGGLVRVTRGLLLAGRSANGGWSRAQYALLGVGWPPPKGWMDGLLGRAVARGVMDEFVRLRDEHLRHKCIMGGEGVSESGAKEGVEDAEGEVQ